MGSNDIVAPLSGQSKLWNNGAVALRDIVSGGKAVDRQKENAWMYYGCAMLVWLRGMYYLAEFLGLCWGWIR